MSITFRSCGRQQKSRRSCLNLFKACSPNCISYIYITTLHSLLFMWVSSFTSICKPTCYHFYDCKPWFYCCFMLKFIFVAYHRAYYCFKFVHFFVLTWLMCIHINAYRVFLVYFTFFKFLNLFIYYYYFYFYLN